MIIISDNLQSVHARIVEAARKFGRNPDDISLLAVSKTRSAVVVAEAASAGQRAFGENYVQEGVSKITALSERALEWHFIGPLQSNKTRLIAENFAWAHSIERLKVAERLSEQRPGFLPPLQICLQVNVSGEMTKSGVAPEETLALARKVAVLPSLRLRGLMAIPEPDDDFSRQRAAFRCLHEVFDNIVKAGFDLDTLSMGMSHDFEAAIAEGSTLVRIGAAIFGERDKK